MRHLLSLIAGVVAAPVAWALLAKGQAGAADTVAAWAKDNAFNTGDLLVPGAYLAGAGIVLGLIATLRISPVGPLVAALGYLGVSAGLFINPFAVQNAIPTKILGQSLPLRTPLLNGTLLVVGALLLIAVFSAQRWRRWPATDAGSSASGSPEGSAEDSVEPEAGWPDTAPATATQPTLVGASTNQAAGTPSLGGGAAAGTVTAGQVAAPPPRHAVDDATPGGKPDSSRSA